MYRSQTALKTNLLFLATTTPNAGVEIALNDRLTLDLWGAYNAWKFPNDMKLNLYLIQPELRYWPCQKFEGHCVVQPDISGTDHSFESPSVAYGPVITISYPKHITNTSSPHFRLLPRDGKTIKNIACIKSHHL